MKMNSLIKSKPNFLKKALYGLAVLSAGVILKQDVFAQSSSPVAPVAAPVTKPAVAIPEVKLQDKIVFPGSETQKHHPKKRIFMILWVGKGLTPVDNAFIDYFKTKGYNVEIEYEDASQSKEKLAVIVDKIKKNLPDLLYIYGTPPVIDVLGKLDNLDPAKHITTVPSIAYIINPVASGMLKDFGPTGRNWTGVSILVPPQAQMDALKKYGDFKKIAAVFSPTEGNAVTSLKVFKGMAEKEGIAVQEFPFRANNGTPDAESVDSVVASAISAKPDLIFFPPDGFVAKHIKKITQATNNAKIPTFTTMEFAVLEKDSVLFGMVAGSWTAGQVGAIQAEKVLYEKIPVSKIDFQTVPQLSFVLRADTLKKVGIAPSLGAIEFAQVLGEE